MFFFFNDTATTEIYTLSLHDALPISEDIATSAGTVRIYRAGPNGEDPYVLLTMLGGNALAWHRWMGRFGDRSVIAVDPFGEPGHSVQTRPVTSRDGQAGWVEELLAGIGAQRAHLVGASWGGYLAVEHELRRPGRVAAISLVEPAGLTTLPWRFWRSGEYTPELPSPPYLLSPVLL